MAENLFTATWARQYLADSGRTLAPGSMALDEEPGQGKQTGPAPPASFPPARLRLTMHFPLRTVSESNQRDHWSKKHARTTAQRTTVLWHLQRTYWRPPALPLDITITRIAPGTLDTDNLASAIKAVQDGIADWLCDAPGKGQDRQAGLTWHYAQRRGLPKDYCIELVIERIQE